MTSLLALPGEIRNRIYDFAFIDPEYIQVTYNNFTDKANVAGISTGITPSALMPFCVLNKQLHTEAVTYFWKKNRFRIVAQRDEIPHTAARAFLAHIGPRRRKLIKHIDIRIPRRDYHFNRTECKSYALATLSMFRRTINLLSKCTSLSFLHVDLDLAEVFFTIPGTGIRGFGSKPLIKHCEELDELAMIAHKLKLEVLEVVWKLPALGRMDVETAREVRRGRIVLEKPVSQEEVQSLLTEYLLLRLKELRKRAAKWEKWSCAIGWVQAKVVVGSRWLKKLPKIERL